MVVTFTIRNEREDLGICDDCDLSVVVDHWKRELHPCFDGCSSDSGEESL